MNTRVLDLVIGVGLGMISVYAIHSFMVVYVCLEMGGTIDKEAGSCLDSDYHEVYLVVTGTAFSIYLIVGLTVSVISVLILKKLWRF